MTYQYKNCILKSDYNSTYFMNDKKKEIYDKYSL